MDNVKQTLRKDFEVVTEWLFEKWMVWYLRKCDFEYLGKDMKNETFFFKMKILLQYQNANSANVY